MRFFLGDFELNSAERRVYLDPDIEGLDMPGIRTSKGQRHGSHGGYIGRQLYDSRFIVLQGRIFSSSIAEALEKRREIQQALPLYPTPIRLRIIDEDGAAYIIFCQVIDFKMPVGRFRGKSNFKIDLEAVDPVIYGDTEGSDLRGIIKKYVPGGMLMSPTSPVFGFSTYFTDSKSNTVINNPSNLLALPTCVIIGRVSDPVLTNRGTGQTFRLTSYSVDESAVTQIDMKNRTVRLGNVSQLVDGMLPDGVGGNMYGYVHPDSEWFGLVPEDNELTFNSSGGSDASEAQIIWRPGYWGI